VDRRARALALVLVVFAVLPIAGTASATQPISYGKLAYPGAFAVPYASATAYTFPSVLTAPSFAGPLADGATVYDTQISVELANAGSSPLTLPVNVSEWTMGARTVSVSPPVNGTYDNYTETVPVRDYFWWSGGNASVTALPGGTGSVSVPLPSSSTPVHLEVRVGQATWEMMALTPATDVATGIYTVGGAWGFGAAMAGITLAVTYGSIALGRRVGRRVHRVPKVPIWWPVCWIAVPVFIVVMDYVPTNQVLGILSPLVIPLPLAAAAFPYGIRLWHDFHWAEFEGVEQRNLENGNNAKAVLPIVTTKRGLRCAPETWREAFWVFWGRDLPTVKGESVDLMGKPIEIQPRGMPVSCPLSSFYEAEAAEAFWFDASKRLTRTRTHLEWWTTETVDRPVKGADGTPGTEKVTKRSFSGTFPPKKPVIEVLSGVRSAEVEAHDSEADRLMNAELQGQMMHMAREYADSEVAAFQRSIQLGRSRRTAEEGRKYVERGKNARRDNGDHRDGS
jgi:hypothetical protein